VEPLSPTDLAEILERTEATVRQIQSQRLPDFVKLRGERLSLDHASLRDWLTEYTRCAQVSCKTGWTSQGRESPAIAPCASEGPVLGWPVESAAGGTAGSMGKPIGGGQPIRPGQYEVPAGVFDSRSRGA
jgi:hypothetical protein